MRKRLAQAAGVALALGVIGVGLFLVAHAWAGQSAQIGVVGGAFVLAGLALFASQVRPSRPTGTPP